MSFLIPALVVLPLAVLVVDLARLRSGDASETPVPLPRPRSRQPKPEPAPFEVYTGPIRMRPELPELRADAARSGARQ